MKSQNPKSSRFFLLSLFFISGFSSLAYQIVWQKVLSQVIGVDHHSVVLIVSIFMLGLGLGGIWGGMLCRRTQSVLKVYAFTELILALYGFFSIQVLRGANSFFHVYNIGYFNEFILNFALLIVPTVLMGMSLPLMIQALRGTLSAGQTVGLVYSANIFGAAIGVVSTGFILIGTLGMQSTCRLAVLLNSLIAAGTIWLSRNSSLAAPMPNKRSAGESGAVSGTDRAWFWPNFLVGFVALGYEIVFFRIFTSYFGATVYVFSIVLFSYLLMMAAGNAFFGRIADQVFSKDLLPKMGMCALLATLFILWGQQAMHILGLRQNYLVLWPFQTWLAYAQILPIFILSILFMGPVFFLSGFFPIFLGLFVEDKKTIGEWAGKIYFTQTIGNFIGTLVTGYVFLPNIGSVNTLKVLGLILILSLSLVKKAGMTAKRRSARMAYFFAAVCCLVFFYPRNFYDTVRYYHESDKKDVQQPFDVREDAFGATLGYVGHDNKMQVYVGRLFSNSFPLESADLNHINSCYPMDWIASIHGLKVRKVLYVGLGAGTGVLCIQKFFPEAEIDVVELNPQLLKLMESHAAALIKDSLSKTNVYVTDGRRFAQHKPNAKYDLIHVGVFNAWCSGCGNVFTQDFLKELSGHLTEHGVVTYNAYPAAVKAGLNVFKDLVVLSPGPSRISEVCASNQDMGSEGGGMRVDAKNFADTMRKLESASGPGSVQIDRTFLQNGSVIPRDRVSQMTEKIEASTDDKPVTEYYLTNNQFIYDVDWFKMKPEKDMRIFECDECPKPLRELAVSK